VLAHLRVILEGGGVVYAEREARWLLEAATGRPSLFEARDVRVGETDEQRALDLARRRAVGEPLQYLTGVAGFRRLELSVGPGVFVPRPETELVAERAMQLLPEGGTVVDVGTGSGAIALSIAGERPDACVWATESSLEALSYAHRNRRALGLAVELVHCDLLSGLPVGLTGRIDVCVSNPPYVPPEERSLLPRDVVDHEPHAALFSGGGGLDVLRRIAGGARDWLRPGGGLVVEIGDRQGAAVVGLLEGLGFLDVRISRDLNGRERVAEGRA
jgi:release factor glutamine methyltransferase